MTTPEPSPPTVLTEDELFDLRHNIVTRLDEDDRYVEAAEWAERIVADRVAAAVQAERERVADLVEETCAHPYVAEDGRKIWMGGFCTDCADLAAGVRNGGQP